MTELSHEMEQYISEHIDPEDELLYQLNRYTNLNLVHPRMISGHLQGKILRMLSIMVRPATILELGTFTGYSAICLAQGLQKGGKLITIEANDEIAEVAQTYIDKSGLSDSITLLVGDARKIIPTLENTFDLVFMDAEKSEYLEYYHLFFDKVTPGGFILADNILWSGKVTIEEDSNDYFTKGIKQFNNFIKMDQRVEKVILPVRDGLMIVRKK
jgi:predicted O-methyltransferase YrrM